jgi:hypothetical protein
LRESFNRPEEFRPVNIDIVTAGLLVIGDEILSGRTKDKISARSQNI